MPPASTPVGWVVGDESSLSLSDSLSALLLYSGASEKRARRAEGGRHSREPAESLYPPPPPFAPAAAGGGRLERPGILFPFHLDSFFPFLEPYSPCFLQFPIVQILISTESPRKFQFKMRARHIYQNIRFCSKIHLFVIFFHILTYLITFYGILNYFLCFLLIKWLQKYVKKH